MELPEEYWENLRNGIITYEMLDTALFSLNKRAKNWRDVKRERKKEAYASASLFGFEIENSIEDAEKMEKEMYDKKMELLTIIPPVCIHKEFAGYSKACVYDTNAQYDSLYLNALFHNGVSDKGTAYLGNEAHQYFLMETTPRYRYYLVRYMGKHAFHTPIRKEEVRNYDLPVYLTAPIKTVGKAERELAPMEFVEEMLQLVRSGNYHYTDDGKKQKILKSFPLEKREYEILQPHEWKEVINILQKYYPEEKCLKQKKLKLSMELWNKIMEQEINVQSCMSAIRSFHGRQVKYIIRKNQHKGKKSNFGVSDL